ncbi:MAG TPA: hypothetical protein VMU82_04505 [Acetobacteraceae bacterium]|nr:hypothetical protein [Acetobacteraceae bacterium]
MSEQQKAGSFWTRLAQEVQHERAGERAQVAQDRGDRQRAKAEERQPETKQPRRKWPRIRA